MIALALAALLSTPTLGLEAGACHTDQSETDVVVAVRGLKDRDGRLRLELYPANDVDFLADDNLLIHAGKVFARVDIATPAAGSVSLCIHVPAPGRYALSLLHDRNANHRFDIATDGIGFAGNPRLGWARPHATDASLTAGPGRTPLTIIMNYLHGFSMRPEK